MKIKAYVVVPEYKPIVGEPDHVKKEHKTNKDET